MLESEVIQRLIGVLSEYDEAARKFIDKCETGRARSSETQGDLRNCLRRSEIELEIIRNRRAAMITDIEKVFEKYQREYLKSEALHQDLAAFNKLYGMGVLVPGDIISSSEHDEIYLNVDMEKFLAAATEEDVLDLVRLGVHYDSSADSLSMFT